MITRMGVLSTIGLVLLTGIGAAGDVDTDQEAAIAAIQTVGGTVTGSPPDTVTLVGRRDANVGMFFVDQIPGLTGIYASDSDVADNGLARIKGLPRLTFLYLKRTKITDQGLAHVKGLTKLQSVDLEGTDIGDAGIVHLRNLPELSFLNLTGTKVTDAGVAALRKTLPRILEIRRASPVVSFERASSVAWPPPAASGSSRGVSTSTSSSREKLPIPDFAISCDLSLWTRAFTIKKMSYDEDQNQVVFVLEAVRQFTFMDDGFDSIKFYDEDGVDLIQHKNVTFDADPKALKAGESTRARLAVPRTEILTRTRRCVAVASGFFMK